MMDTITFALLFLLAFSLGFVVASLLLAPIDYRRLGSSFRGWSRGGYQPDPRNSPPGTINPETGLPYHISRDGTGEFRPDHVMRNRRNRLPRYVIRQGSEGQATTESELDSGYTDQTPQYRIVEQRFGKGRWRYRVPIPPPAPEPDHEHEHGRRVRREEDYL
jgi:hypothetical protein